MYVDEISKRIIIYTASDDGINPLIYIVFIVIVPILTLLFYGLRRRNKKKKILEANQQYYQGTIVQNPPNQFPNNNYVPSEMKEIGHKSETEINEYEHSRTSTMGESTHFSPPPGNPPPHINDASSPTGNPPCIDNVNDSIATPPKAYKS